MGNERNEMHAAEKKKCDIPHAWEEGKIVKITS